MCRRSRDWKGGVLQGQEGHSLALMENKNEDPEQT